MKKIIGIIGGMGPEATADLFMKIIKATPAQKDQDHIRVLIDSNTDIADRTKAILGTGPTPAIGMQETADKLITAGAEILVMPCNTAHYFYDDIVINESIVFLHMMKETVNYIKTNYPEVQTVGILATSGTISTGMYHKALKENELIPLEPDNEQQQKVMDAIYSSWGIKAGHYEKSRESLKEAGMSLVERGAEAVIMGCTEIPLALRGGDLPVPLIDATLVLAQAAVKAALTQK